MTISLSDLKALRAAMTQGEWERIGHTFACPGLDVGWCTFGRDAAGIVATHNAADALIEIAEAALEVRAAKKCHARAFHRCSSDPATAWNPNGVAEVDRLATQIVACESRLRAALARIKP